MRVQANKPAASDTVVVHYRGTLTNGAEFDSSIKRNQPATFGLNSIIPGVAGNFTVDARGIPLGSCDTTGACLRECRSRRDDRPGRNTDIRNRANRN